MRCSIAADDAGATWESSIFHLALAATSIVRHSYL